MRFLDRCGLSIDLHVSFIFRPLQNSSRALVSVEAAPASGDKHMSRISQVSPDSCVEFGSLSGSGRGWGLVLPTTITKTTAGWLIQQSTPLLMARPKYEHFGGISDPLCHGDVRSNSIIKWSFANSNSHNTQVEFKQSQNLGTLQVSIVSCTILYQIRLRDYHGSQWGICLSFSQDNSKLRTKIMRSLLYLNYLIAITDITCAILRMSMEDY